MLAIQSAGKRGKACELGLFPIPVACIAACSMGKGNS